MRTLIALPLVTEKSFAGTEKGTYQFVVPVWATKPMIRQHIATHFNVEVASVTTTRYHRDVIRFRAKPGERASWKKAFVRLAKGQTLPDFSLPIEPTETEAPAKVVDAPQVATKSTITVRKRGDTKKNQEKS